jgi:hypothetical protein
MLGSVGGFEPLKLSSLTALNLSIELAEAKPKAFSAWLLECEKERVLRNFHDPTQH